MKKLIKKIRTSLNSEKGQGAIEYILLLVVIVAIAGLFKNQIKSAVGDKLTDLQGRIQGFSGE